MMRLRYLITCEKAIKGERNKGSFIDVFDQIFTVDVPALHPAWTVALKTEGEPGTYQEVIEVIHLETNEVAARGEVSVNILPEGGGNTLVVNFVNTIFPEFGRYWIKVTVNGQPDPLTDPSIHFITIERTPGEALG